VNTLKKFLQLASIGVVALLGACSGEPVDGAALAAEKGCIACHGQDGKAIADIYPNLNGQWERYLRLQLQAYRSEKRVNAVMYGMAKDLTDEEIRILAAHYGK
jgi:cytochrome c553|tara:strand:+ start:445 stop:753 length:309 start_codon:yes stop_codon:yes gene_type:complete